MKTAEGAEEIEDLPAQQASSFEIHVFTGFHLSDSRRRARLARALPHRPEA
jgi:hypothetical protein